MKCWSLVCTNEITPTSPNGRPKYYCSPRCAYRERDRMRGKGKRECACGCQRAFVARHTTHRFFSDECAAKGAPAHMTKEEKQAQELVPLAEKERLATEAAEAAIALMVTGEASFRLWARCLDFSA